MCASAEGHLSLVGILLGNGASKVTKDMLGQTAMSLAGHHHGLERRKCQEPKVNPYTANQGQSHTSVLPHDSSMLCSTPQLSNVFRALLPVRNEWKNIGVLVGCDQTTLACINKDQASDCLREMLSERLKQIDPPLSWKMIIEAVEHLNPRAAQKILQSTK